LLSCIRMYEMPPYAGNLPLLSFIALTKR
jgi:hypothetical protein